MFNLHILILNFSGIVFVKSAKTEEKGHFKELKSEYLES